ncbi:MAG: aminomethyltransferase beta-barrel domain-containing protein [Pyrinomonadaceae bacterium]
MSKAEVRDLARQNDLSVAEKAESQEICFVPDGNYAGFIDRYLAAENKEEMVPATGEIVNLQGAVLGEHTGVHRYTVGQRRGLQISHPRPLYVLSIDSARNRVVVGESEELLTREFTAAGVNWISCETPDAYVKAEVRVRYRHEPASAIIESLEGNNKRARVVFDAPQKAITPGQATVFYQGEEVVGGGWIVKSNLVPNL